MGNRQGYVNSILMTSADSLCQLVNGNEGHYLDHLMVISDL